MSDLARSREAAKEYGEEEIATVVIDSAFQLHTDLGPGLLESVYSIIFTEILRDRGLSVEREVAVPIHYREKKFDLGFRADILVEQKVCIELKSSEVLAPVHAKQLLTYLKLLDYRLGLLINFGASRLKDGVKRVSNGLPSTKYPLRDFAASREKKSS
jgi:iron complex transport system substrate-binding protein